MNAQAAPASDRTSARAKASRMALRLLDMVWITVLMLYTGAGVGLVPFHGDESTQIYMTRDYAYQFIQRDFSKLTYDPAPQNNPDPDFATQQELRLLNGTLPKTLMGFAWHTAGYQLADINKQWLWGADWDWNLQNGHIPSDGLLNITRAAMTALLMAAVPTVFLLGRMLNGRIAAYSVSLLFALSPVLLLNGRRAMMESALMLFSVLTVVAGAYLLRQRGMRGALLLGVAAGLAVASKHTAIMAVLPIFIAGGLWTLWALVKHPREGVRLLVLLIVAGVLSLAVFGLLNPAWWGNPLTVGRVVLDLRADLLTNQAQFFTNYADWNERLLAFWRNVFVQAPQYYEVSDWAGFIGGQISAYEASWLKGAGGTDVYAIVLAALAALGLVGLLKRDPNTRAARWMVFVWAVGAAALVLALTTFEWQRYYIPAILPLLVLAGNGVAAFVHWLRLSNLFTLDAEDANVG